MKTSMISIRHKITVLILLYCALVKPNENKYSFLPHPGSLKSQPVISHIHISENEITIFLAPVRKLSSLIFTFFFFCSPHLINYHLEGLLPPKSLPVLLPLLNFTLLASHVRSRRMKQTLLSRVHK